MIKNLHWRQCSGLFHSLSEDGGFDNIHNCYYYVNKIMHMEKDFELSKTLISQHLAWLSTFF